MTEDSGHGSALDDPTPQQPEPAAAAAVAGIMTVTVAHNDRSSIVIAAGPVTMSARQLLPTAAIPVADLDVVRSAAWVAVGVDGRPVKAAEAAAALLSVPGPGLAVIAGAPGYGKRTTGVRALWETCRAEYEATGTEPPLVEIRPDWNDPSAPDLSLLPEEAGTGYLLDVAAEIGDWTDPRRVARGLVGHAETLRRKGSFLVVVADERTWPTDESGGLARVVVPADVRPSAHRVAAAHLRHLHHAPDRVHLVEPAGSPAGRAGEAADLLTGSSSPADAVRLAGLLAAADGTTAGIAAARSSFREWRSEIESAFASTQDNADDRALLIAALFLPGEEALAVDGASRDLLGERPKTSVRDILTGPDLTARLTAVGAEVDGRRVTLDHRPGYARAALRHLWRQRADIHAPLLEWLGRLTQPKNAGARLLAPISDLLVDLAIAENDVRVIEEIRNWIGNGTTGTSHLELIAGVLARTAEADGVGPAVRGRLLGWAQDKDEAVASTVALVCRTSFADDYPRQALVRLRHILGRSERDRAVVLAEDALRAFAATDRHLGRVWISVAAWAKDPADLAGHRGFLALVDPSTDSWLLRTLLESAEGNAEVARALVDAWSATLLDGRVHGEAGRVLIAWAQVHAQGDPAHRAVLTGVLRQVVTRHMMTTPIAALVYGEPNVRYDEAVIALRKELAIPVMEAFDFDDATTTITTGGRP
ncbi:hypothetical protein [Kitasatospora sp. NPDC088134]|uniref:hypothetical protein n=1 Tax=Kitasatospora sp. NPDC088134 TaxID=3364071 RepID=UPI003819B9D9